MDLVTIVLTNGRQDCIQRMMHSMGEHISERGTHGVIVDDSGDPDYREWLEATYGEYWIIDHVAQDPAGYAHAIRRIWEIAANYDFVFLVEDDFVFLEPFKIRFMASSLVASPRIAQWVFLRQPWFGNEIDAGGLIQALQARGENLDLVNPCVTLQRATWSTNPTVFRGRDWVIEHPWPEGAGSEYKFGQTLFQAEPDTFCGYLHGPDFRHLVEHIGERKGFGY